MKLSTCLRLAAAVLLASPVAMAQSGKTDRPVKPAETASQFVPPVNDNFASAINITAAGQQTLSSTVDATAETGEPVVPAACATGDSNQSVWYKFTAGASGPVTLDTEGSIVATPPGPAGQFTDTILSIYTGATLATLAQVACNDDDPTNTGVGNFTSRIENFAATLGTTYYVRVSSFGTAATATRYNGEVRLTATGTFTVPSGPSLSVTPGTVAFGTVAVGQTRTQTVTITNNGTAAVNITAIAFTGSTQITATGTAAGSLAVGASRTVTLTYTPTNATAQSGTLSITSNAPGSPATVTVTGTGNADVTSTIPPGTTIGGPTFNRSTNLGTGASGSCTLSTTAVTVAYRARQFTIATAGNYTITTDFSGTAGYDGFIFLYRTSFAPADPCLNLVALDDDFLLPPNTSALQAAQIAGQPLTPGTYVLVVTGFGNGSAGTFTGTVVGPSAAIFAVAGEGTAANSRSSLSAAPNPFQGTATVRFTTAVAQDVTVVVYDVTGRQVATLFAGAVAADQEVAASLDGSQLPAGVYVIRATGADVNLTQRVTVVR